MSPQIKEYTAEATSLRPTETGIDALSQVGRRAGGFYNQAAEAMKGGAEAQARAAGAVATADENVARSVSGIAKSVDEAAKQADDFVTHQEISHGAKSFAQVHSDMTDEWNDTAKNADPNDTSIAGKFRETVLEPKLEEFSSAFHTTRGQQWAESHTMALRDHMAEKQSADMATLAGDAVAVNVRQTTNAWSNTARNDPSSVPFLLQTADASIAGIVSSSPNLKGTEAAKVHSQVTQKAKEEIVKAGALGAIEKSGDPEAAAAAFAKRYPQYVNAQEIDQFAKAARQFNSMNRAEARFQREDSEHKAKLDLNQKALDLETQTLPKKPGDSPTLPPDYWDKVRDLHLHPGAALEPSIVHGLINKGEAITTQLNKPEPIGRVSHDTTMDLIGKIRAGQMPDNTPIYDALKAGSLNRADFKFLVDEHSSLKTPEGEALGRDRKTFFDRFSATIDPGRDQATGAGGSALGSQKMYAAEMEARRLEGVLRAQGKDPHSLYNPSSPDFFGNQVTRFRPSLAEKAAFDAQAKADAAAKPSPPPPAEPARKVGDRQQFKQGWGVWNGTAWVPEK